jgi:hypothetical protein
LPLSDRLLQAQQVGVGLRKLDADRVELFDGDQMGGLALADQSPPSVTKCAPDAAGNRRWRDGVFEVEPGLGRGGLSLLDARLGGIEFLLADRLDLEQRPYSGRTPPVPAARSAAAACGLCLVGAGVDAGTEACRP